VATSYLKAQASVKYLVIVVTTRSFLSAGYPDDGFVANEAAYAMRAVLLPLNAASSALERGYILTDDFYADRDLCDGEGVSFTCTDLAIGRLVEKPREIIAVVDAFLASSRLSPSTAWSPVMTFDRWRTSDSRFTRLVGICANVLISDAWTAGDLTSKWLSTATQDVAVHQCAL